MVTPSKPARKGKTHTSEDGDRVPRTPNERDESSDSTDSEPREVMEQARKDVESGKVDTSRSEATDKTYRDNLRGTKGDGGKR